MRILFLTPRFPYPPLKGDTLRTYHQIRALSRDHNITLLSLADAPVSREDYARVAQLCEHVEVVPLPRWRGVLNMALGAYAEEPLQVSYYRSVAFQEKLNVTLAREHFDIVHVTLIRMLPYIWERRDLPVVVDLIDSLGLNLEARRNGVAGPLHMAYEMEYQRVMDYEHSLVDRFPSLVVSSPADKQMLGGKHVDVIPNGVDLDKFTFRGPEASEERSKNTLIFTGNMGYGPNAEAVLWFIDEVWPLILRKRPDLRFQIVGTNPGKRVRNAAQQARNVQVLGRVPHVTSFLHTATIAVCPMRSGSGIQNKVLEAMATGTPVVATRIANRGVGGKANRDLILADAPADFACEVDRLLDNANMRAQLAEAGRALVEREFRWEEHARRLVQVYQRSSECPVLSSKSASNNSKLKTMTSIEAKGQNSKLNVMQMTDVTGRGGAEKALVDIALRLDKSRYNVTVCATRSAGNYQPILDDAGVTTYIQGRRSRWDFGQWLKLIRLMRREHVDVLHTHLFGSNTLGRIAGRLAGVPVIIAHEHWSTRDKREIRVDRALYRLSDRILVPSEASKRMVQALEGIPATKIEVLYNGVDIANFSQDCRQEVRAELHIPEDAIVAGVVGRLSPEKGGVDLLIRAAKRLHEDNPWFRLLIVGDGPLRAGLESVAAESVRDGTVLFTGTRNDVARLLSAMDIFVLPSLNEALPIVVLEAMAAGLPVVATRVGGVPEIIEHGKSGLLVQPGSEDAIYSALQRLTSDDDLRNSLALAGRSRVIGEFTIERMVERVQSLYDDLLQQKRPDKVAGCRLSVAGNQVLETTFHASDN